MDSIIITSVCCTVMSCCTILRLYFFFFQAEDGIRDRNVTGVQTCALPIFTLMPGLVAVLDAAGVDHVLETTPNDARYFVGRSEERRVGKECSSRGLGYL